MATLIALSANAAEVRDARINTEKGTVDIDVSYGGGCREHKFELKLETCMESYPVQCTAKLIDLTTDDYCEAYISQTVSISLKESGLTDSYFSKGSLTITGSGNSRAHVQLP